MEIADANTILLYLLDDEVTFDLQDGRKGSNAVNVNLA